jgi:hypothetical protein
MTPEETVADACPKIRDLGWAFYFAPETLAKGAALGLDGLRFYVIGRGGVLGNVDSSVIRSAFGYFEPGLVEKMWTSAKEKVAPRVAASAYMACGAAFGRSRFAGLPDLDAFCAAAGAVNDAADPVGLALYSGIKSEPLAGDLPARAMQLLTVLREFRGSAHLIAIRASGLDAKTAHFIRRPADVGMFGWSDADAPAITEVEVAKLAAADELTDRLVLPAYSVLDAAGRDALVSGLDRIAAALDERAQPT